MSARSLTNAVVLCAVLVHAAGGQDSITPAKRALTPIGRMDPTVIKESSGIAKSPRHEGIFWTHNDSGNAAELFAIKADGTLVATIPVEGAPNLDWEDIAIAGGFIYIGDIGNNHGLMRVRFVYKFAEPNPLAADIKPIKPLTTYRYKYPDKLFDSEALLVRGDRIYVIRKAGGKASAVYRLTPTDGKYMVLDEVQVLRSGVVSGADLSRDGRYLVTASSYQLAWYPVNDDMTFREGEPAKFVRYPVIDMLEACCFDGDDVLMTAETGFIYRIPAQDVQRQTRFVRAPRSGGGR